jgi:hypothetical protein
MGNGESEPITNSVAVSRFPCSYSRFPIPDSHSPYHDLSLESVAWDAEQMSPYELLTGLKARLPRRYSDVAPDSPFPIPDSREAR